MNSLLSKTTQFSQRGFAAARSQSMMLNRGANSSVLTQVISNQTRQFHILQARAAQSNLRLQVNQNMFLLNANQRYFFGKNNEAPPKEDLKAKLDDARAEGKEEEKAAEASGKEGAKAEEKKSGAEGTSSDETSDEVDLTKEDIDKIKNLISEQDETIEKHEKENEKLQKELKKFKTELIYQRAENDNTIKRYRKQIDEGKQFAISKFAKELLDVRDNLALALEHIDIEKLNNTEDIDMLKVQMQNIVSGQEMTTKVMDKVLGKFDVKQFDPIGEKFDPNIHDAVFIIPESEEHKPDHVGQVLQTGWKIGSRVLRAAKCGIVKK